MLKVTKAQFTIDYMLHSESGGMRISCVRWGVRWAKPQHIVCPGFAFDYSESTKAVLMGLRPAIYDVVLMGKRKNYQK